MGGGVQVELLSLGSAVMAGEAPPPDCVPVVAISYLITCLLPSSSLPAAEAMQEQGLPGQGSHTTAETADTRLCADVRIVERASCSRSAPKLLYVSQICWICMWTAYSYKQCHSFRLLSSHLLCRQ